MWKRTKFNIFQSPENKKMLIMFSRRYSGNQIVVKDLTMIW